MKVLYLNSVCGFGSTGKLVCSLAKENDSLVCYGRKNYSGNDIKTYKIANFGDNAISALKTIVFDNNLELSKRATNKLINKILEYNPDIIHLHNLHGYYINIKMLFEFLSRKEYPIVWTLHDCWSFTGYCPHYDYVECNAFVSGCNNKECKYGFAYPFSIRKQNIEIDYKTKKQLFNSVKDMTIVTPSNWLKDEVSKSFLKDKRIEVINNGIEINELSEFKRDGKFNILFVANYWTEEKGINEIKKIIPLLNKKIEITIVGKIKNKKDFLNRCRLIDRTDNYNQLTKLYMNANIFVNTTLQENFPTVNLEAMSFGTPIITYRTGGASEMIDEETGIVVEKYDYKAMADAINTQAKNYTFNNKEIYVKSIKYSKKNMTENYRKLYNSILS